MNNGSSGAFFPFLLFILAIVLILTSDPNTPQETVNGETKDLVVPTTVGDVYAANSWISCPIPSKRNLVCEMVPVNPDKIVAVDLDTCDVFTITEYGQDITLFTNAKRKDQNCINGVDIIPPSKTQ